jgi:hypothetical protein
VAGRLRRIGDQVANTHDRQTYREACASLLALTQDLVANDWASATAGADAPSPRYRLLLSRLVPAAAFGVSAALLPRLPGISPGHELIAAQSALAIGAVFTLLRLDTGTRETILHAYRDASGRGS